MAQKLKIYACSGVGDVEEQTTGYWLDDTKTLSNTQAVNNLLSMINLKMSELNSLTLSEKQRIDTYNSIDSIVVALRLAEKYQDNRRLILAGSVFTYYISTGYFVFNSTDDEERSKHLEELYNTIVRDIDCSTMYDVSDEDMQWWYDEVVELNKVGLNPEQQAAIEDAISGIGATGGISGDLNTYLSDAKSYFLYTFIPEGDIKNWPAIIQQRRKKQLEIYDYCLPIYKELNGTEAAMQRIIRSSICNTFHLTPEAVLRRIKEGKAKDPYKVAGVGDFGITEAVATVIAAVISAVIAIITAVLQCVGQVYAAKYTVPEDAYSGIPEDSDFDDFKGGNSNTLLWIGAAILGIILIGNKRKKK